jgi:integrase
VADIVEYSTGEPMQFYTAAEWLRHWAKGKSEAKSKGTAVRYNGVIEDYIKFLGKRSALNLSHLTVKDVHSYRTKLKKSGLAPNTCNFAVKAISNALNAALKQGLITTNPATAIESLPIEQSEKTPFTQQQIKKLSSVASPDWKLAILLGYCTGLRLSDIANMTWNAVDFEKGIIQIVPKKTRNIRKVVFIPIHPQLKDALLDVAGQDDPEAPILPTMAGKQTGGAHGLSKTFAGLMEKASIDPQPYRNKEGKGRTMNRLSFHSLRHSFNSMLANKGIAGEVRQQLTGHSSDAMNQKYTHLELERLREAVRVIPNL